MLKRVSEKGIPKQSTQELINFSPSDPHETLRMNAAEWILHLNVFPFTLLSSSDSTQENIQWWHNSHQEKKLEQLLSHLFTLCALVAHVMYTY